MQVPERVQIAPLGYEYHRVLLPARKYQADQVILLEHEPEDERPWYHAELRAALREDDIEVNDFSTNLFDLYRILGDIATLIATHGDDEVYVNLTTGSKVSAIAGMIACMVERNDASVTPFYVLAERYSEEDGEGELEDLTATYTNGEEGDDLPVAFGMRDVTEIPTYPIQGPLEHEIRMLNFIESEEPVPKHRLIQEARGKVDRFRRKAAKDDIGPDDDPGMGEYRLLKSHILEPLEDRECITIEEIGRSKEVSTTEKGRNTLQAFEYLLVK